LPGAVAGAAMGTIVGLAQFSTRKTEFAESTDKSGKNYTKIENGYGAEKME
jgi:hypothetical protein